MTDGVLLHLLPSPFATPDGRGWMGRALLVLLAVSAAACVTVLGSRLSRRVRRRGMAGAAVGGRPVPRAGRVAAAVDVRASGHNPGMADTEAGEAGIETDDGRLDDTGLYWFGEFCRLGMCSPQAAVLASRDTVDRHAVREWLTRGCDPDVAFLIAS